MAAIRRLGNQTSGTARGTTGTIAFIADDERAAGDALEGAGIEYNERPALTIRMENVAGAGAKAFRKLSMLASTLICSFRFESRPKSFGP